MPDEILCHPWWKWGCQEQSPAPTLTFHVSRRGRIELGDVTPHNIKQLKLLNQVVFPVSYNDKFYKDVLEAGELAKLGEDQERAGLCAAWLPV